MMTRAEVFHEVGGFDESFPLNYNDVDFCFKLHQAGLRCVYEPDVELLHYESATREVGVHPDEISRLQSRWSGLLRDDPYYHPEFFQRNPDFHVPPMLSNGRFISAH